MTIHPDLEPHPDLEALAFLLGRWEGAGIGGGVFALAAAACLFLAVRVFAAGGRPGDKHSDAS